MKRTIAGGRQAFVESPPALSGLLTNEDRKTLAAAEEKAKEYAGQFLDTKSRRRWLFGTTHTQRAHLYA
jgi:hypothetical protein